MLNQTLIEPRYHCPVCLGLPMQKLKITQTNKDVFLTLDYCKRCGGVWFDQGEVDLSKQIKSPKVRQRIIQQPRKWMIHCRDCNTLMDRNHQSCGSCGWQNQISCPVCDKALQRKQHGQLTLDVCHSCQGIWFDQAELVSLWNDSSTNLSHPSKHTSDLPQQSNSGVVSETARQIAVEGGLNSIAYGAEVVVEPGLELMAKTASTAAQGSVKVLANSPETAGSVVESLAEVTGSALEILTDSETITVILEASGEIAGGMVEILATAIAGLLSG